MTKYKVSRSSSLTDKCLTPFLSFAALTTSNSGSSVEHRNTCDALYQSLTRHKRAHTHTFVHPDSTSSALKNHLFVSLSEKDSVNDLIMAPSAYSNALLPSADTLLSPHPEKKTANYLNQHPHHHHH